MALPTYATTNLQTQDYRTSVKPARPTCDCCGDKPSTRRVSKATGRTVTTWNTCDDCDGIDMRPVAAQLADEGMRLAAHDERGGYALVWVSGKPERVWACQEGK